MVYQLLFLFVLVVGVLGDDYVNTPINSSSGLYYEGIGEAYVSNNNWEFVTYIDYGDYLIFYQYIHQQAEKLREFCNTFNMKISNSTECDKKLAQVETNLKLVTGTHETMSNYLGLTSKRRKKRFWQAAAAIAAPYILQPLGEGLARSLFGNNDRQQFEAYDHQISALHNSQNDIINEIQNQRTIFKIDSETKSKQIDYLKRAQDRLEEQLTVVKETIVRDYVEKEKQIKELNDLLEITRSQLKEQEKINEEHSKDILRINNAVKELNTNLEELGNQVFSNTERINNAEIRIRLSSAAQDFLFIWSVFQVEQETLFEGIVNSNNRHLDPYVITPVKLVDLVQKALAYLPEGTKFPVHPDFENAMELYNLVEPNIYFYNYTIVFRLNIKLVNTNTFYLYRIHSLPVSIDKSKFLFIMPEKPYLLIDSNERQYALMTQEQLEKCNVLHNSKFLCADTSEYIDITNPVCEVNLFVKDEISDNCNIRTIMPLRPFALQLTKRTSWIYVVPRINTLVVKCGNRREGIGLRNSGFLDTGDCLAWLNGTILKHALVSYDGFSTKMHNYSPNVKIGKFVNTGEIMQSLKNKEPVVQRIVFPYDFNDMKKELEFKSIQVNYGFNPSSKPRSGETQEINTKDDRNKMGINLTVVIAVAIVTITLIGLIIFVNRLFHCNVQNNQSSTDNMLILK